MQYDVRAMSFGEILDTGFRLLANHFVLLSGIAAIVYVPMALLGSFVEPDRDGRFLMIAGGVWLVTLLISPIVTGAVAFAIGEVYLGREVTIGAALRTGLSLMAGLVGTGFLSTLAILAGLVLLIVPGIYLTLAFMLLTPVMVFERTFGPRALGRSRALMRGNFGRAFGILLVSTLVTSVLGWSVNLVLGAVPMAGPIASAIAQTLTMAYLSAVIVLLYFDIRSRKEAFDVEHLAQTVEAQLGGPVVASPAT